MKQKIIIIIICFCLILSFISLSNNKAHADVLTASTVAAVSYAIAQYSGLSFNFADATANGVKNAMESYMNNWLNGRTIAEAFGTELARIELGKLIVPATLFNNIRNFLNDMVSDNNLESGDAIIFPGMIDGTVIDNLNQNWGKTDTGFSVSYTATANRVSFTFYYNGRNSYGGGYNWTGGSSMQDAQANGWTISQYENNKIHIVYVYSVYRTDLQERQFFTHEVTATISNLQVSDTGTGSISGGYSPTVLNPTQDWATSSYVGPDTNLDDLMEDIFEEVADNNLYVDGEVIDEPIPPGPVPTWTPVDDVIDGINQGGEILDGIGNDIGDIAGHVGDIGDQLGDVTDALDGVQQGIQTQTGVISGAMDQAVDDIVDAIGSQTATLDDSLSDIADILTAPAIDTPKFDLRELFPFCIPFDIYHLLQKFDGTPVAPHVQLPIVIPSIGFSYTLDLDFSAWNPVAAAMRTAELIVYALGLAWATSKVIKW